MARKKSARRRRVTNMSDCEQLQATLADDLKALRGRKSVLGIEEMADAVQALGPAYAVNAASIRSAKNTWGLSICGMRSVLRPARMNSRRAVPSSNGLPSLNGYALCGGHPGHWT
jgi:hypothetical protein